MLGQYRFPVRHYWRGLTVQLVAYEAQYELHASWGELFLDLIFVWLFSQLKAFQCWLFAPNEPALAA